MNENEQETLGTEEPQKRPYYICINSVTSKGFLDELNKAQEQGYKPIRDWYDELIIEKKDGTEYTQRSVICYDSEATGIDAEETSNRVNISQDILDAEFQATKAVNDLKDVEDFYLLNADWDIISEEIGQKITNQKQKDAYIRKQCTKDREWMETTKQWLAHVKRLAGMHERAGTPPWTPEPEPQKEAVEVEG